MVSCAKQRGPRGDHTDSRVSSNMSISIYILKISYSFIIIRNMYTVERIHMYYVYECTCVKQRTMPVGIITGTNTVRVPGPPVVARLPCKRRMISGIGAGESFARSIRTVLYVLYYYNTYATHPGTNALMHNSIVHLPRSQSYLTSDTCMHPVYTLRAPWNTERNPSCSMVPVGTS